MSAIVSHPTSLHLNSTKYLLHLHDNLQDNLLSYCITTLFEANFTCEVNDTDSCPLKYTITRKHCVHL